MRFGGGQQVGTERERRAARQGADEELAARNGWQMNRHDLYLRAPGLSLKPKLQAAKDGPGLRQARSTHSDDRCPASVRVGLAERGLALAQEHGSLGETALFLPWFSLVHA